MNKSFRGIVLAALAIGCVAAAPSAAAPALRPPPVSTPPVLAPVTTETFADDWSFTDAVSGSTVTGTLSGLMDGSNVNVAGLVATVTSAPYADLLGSYSVDVSKGYGRYNTYSASGGFVQAADFILGNSVGARLYFGTDPETIGGTTYYPQLLNADKSELAEDPSAGTVFSATSVSAVPEAGTWLIMILGFGAIGGVMRRAHCKSEDNFTRKVRSIAAA